MPKTAFIGLILIITALALFPVKPVLADATAANEPTYFSAIQTSGITFAYVSDNCKKTGDCTLNDIMQVFVNITNFILGIVGSLTLAVAIYGGFLWLTSGGASEKIEKGKAAMTGSIIGLLIVFGAFTGINFISGALRGGTAGQENLCEVVSPANGGKAGMGYACLNNPDTTIYTCDPTPNLCPGDQSVIKCCISTPTTTTP